MSRQPAPKRGSRPSRPSGTGGGRGRPGSDSGGKGGAGGKGRSASPGRGSGGPPPRRKAERATVAESAPRGAARRPGPAAAKGLGGEQVEGRQAVRELLLAGRRRVRELWLAEDLDPAPILDDILELATEARVLVHEVGRVKLDKAARTDAPQGVLAFADALPEARLDDLLDPPPGAPAPFLLVCDGITDPGNLGALLRSAECAGVTGVVLPRHRAVHVTPSVTKAAAGAIEHLPMALVGGLPTALRTMKERGVWVLGFDDAADRVLWEVELGDEPVAVVLGAEGPGMGRLVRERCDQVVRIPMRGRVSSLNVGTAGALACFEVARHRSR